MLAARIAQRLAQRPGVLEASCLLVSRIGRPVKEPWFAQVRLRSEGGSIAPEHARAAQEELERALASLPEVTDGLVSGAIAGH